MVGRGGPLECISKDGTIVDGRDSRKMTAVPRVLVDLVMLIDTHSVTHPEKIQRAQQDRIS